jgi:DNA processing protein
LKKTELSHQIALTLLKGIGPIKARHLISKLGSIDSLFTESISSISKRTKIKIEILQKMDRNNAMELAKKHLDFIEKQKIKTLFYQEKEYPDRLGQCSDSPVLLYQLGTTCLNHRRVVSIVGTRHATDYGRAICEELIKGFVNKEVMVVSGLAYGIDVYVHQLCVKYGVSTVGVLGHGLDRIYPAAHTSIAKKMIQNGGIVTEYLPGTKPDRENFPMRNRIVAGLSDATIVIESKRSGGSLITADLANDYARDVFAYPGNVGQTYSEGCNQLISQQKAHLITSSSDFMKWMQWEKPAPKKPVQRSLFIEFSESEQKIISLLQTEGKQRADYMALKIQQPVSRTHTHLLNLEIAGMIRNAPGNRYDLIQKQI